jgi:hypothetical protein
MRKIVYLSFALAMAMSSFFCNAQTTNKDRVVSTGNKVEAFYFHHTVRCVTCKAVESETKADLESLYGGQVSFKALNLEDDATKSIAEKYKVSGQTVLIVKGDEKINLTNEGFLYAVTNPAKYKSIIKARVDKLLDL